MMQAPCCKQFPAWLNLHRALVNCRSERSSGYGYDSDFACKPVSPYLPGAAQLKFASSSMLPFPEYWATCGY